MQSLTIFMQSWTIYLHLNNILELFVFRKIGWHPLPMWHYLIYPIINWYTKVQQKCCYEVRNLYSSSNIWEGLYIDVTGHNLPERLTIGNIYRPPHDNNNNKNIETFINEMLPFIDKLKKENIYAVISGDFNINLLQINEREKFDDFFDMMCTNIFYPKIMSRLVLPNDLIAFWTKYFAKSLARKKLICLLLYFEVVSEIISLALLTLKSWTSGRYPLNIFTKDQ